MSCLGSENLVCSPCSTPKQSLAEVLPAYSKLGYRKFEVFTEWAESRFDIDQPPSVYKELGEQYNMKFTSMHLPAIANLEEDLDRAVRAAKFAEAIGVEVVLFKGKSKELLIEGGKRYLDMAAGINVTPVVQNHKGTPIETVDDYRIVLDGINDSRMKTVLEVGMFHTVGISWREGWEGLKDTMALVHIKDQIGAERVPFGEGEVDLKGLFDQLNATGYAGNIVVEMEVCRDDYQGTLQLLADAKSHCEALLSN